MNPLRQGRIAISLVQQTGQFFQSVHPTLAPTRHTGRKPISIAKSHIFSGEKILENGGNHSRKIADSPCFQP
jgi:hypothetical protein